MDIKEKKVCFFKGSVALVVDYVTHTLHTLTSNIKIQILASSNEYATVEMKLDKNKKVKVIANFDKFLIYC